MFIFICYNIFNIAAVLSLTQNILCRMVASVVNNELQGFGRKR